MGSSSKKGLMVFPDSDDEKEWNKRHPEWLQTIRHANHEGNVTVITDRDEENEIKTCTIDDVHPDFFKIIEKANQEGTIDPDMNQYYKMVADQGKQCKGKKKVHLDDNPTSSAKNIHKGKTSAGHASHDGQLFGGMFNNN